jgi:hypothetical protein
MLHSETFSLKSIRAGTLERWSFAGVWLSRSRRLALEPSEYKYLVLGTEVKQNIKKVRRALINLGPLQSSSLHSPQPEE